MKKIILFLFILSIIPVYLFSWSTYLADQGTPIFTYYLGDNLQYIFSFAVNQETSPMTVTYGLGTSTDGTGWTWRAAEWSHLDGNNRYWKSKSGEHQFSSTGSWYYSGKFVWTDGGYTEYASGDWGENRTSLSAGSYFTVSALNNPSDLTIAPNSSNPNEALDISQNQDAQSHSVLIVRRAGQAVSWTPSQGTNYDDWDTIGDNTIVRGSEAGTSITDDNDGNGLGPNTTYYYKIYSENWQYYSSGITGDQQTLPVTLSTFTAQYLAGKPLLYWTTQSETDNMGWFMYRNKVEDFTSATKVSGMIEGHGTTTQAQSYIFEDVIADPQVGDVYYYWLESVDYSGTIHHFDKVAMITIPETNDPNQNVTPPQVYELISSPNPFNETTNIKFMLTQTAFVDVAIYDVKGALVKSFDTKHVTAEVPVSLQWNGKDENGKSLSNGIYLYSVKVNGQDYATKQVILMK